MGNQNNINLEPRSDIPEPKIRFSGKNISLVLLGVVLLIGVSGAGGYFLYKKLNPVIIQQQITQEKLSQPQVSDSILWNSPQEIQSTT